MAYRRSRARGELVQCRSRLTCCRLTDLRRGAAFRYLGMSAVTTVDDDRTQTELSKLKIACFITYVPPLRQRPEISSDGFPWVIGVIHLVTVGVGNSTSLAIFAWIKTST